MSKERVGKEAERERETPLFTSLVRSFARARLHSRSLLASDSQMEAIVARYDSSSRSDDDIGCSEGDDDCDGDQRPARGGETTTTTTSTTRPDESINDPSSLPRSRSFPHVEGNYAVHVYIPVCLSPQQAQSAIELVRRVNSKLQSSSAAAAAAAATPSLALDRRLDASRTSSSSSSSSSSPTATTLHLSLSRCAPLTRPQWHSFLEALRTCLTAEEAGFAASTTGPGPGSGQAVSLRGLAALANDRRATTFLALGSQRASSPSYPSSRAVSALVRAVDAAAALAGMPPLRQRHESEFVPHVSLGWLPGDEASKVGEAAARVEEEEEEGREREGGRERGEEGGRGVLRELCVPVERVVCRVGKREHVVWQARQKKETVKTQ